MATQPRKWLMLFPWGSKGITSKMPQLWIPTRAKLEKKAVFSPRSRDEATTYYDRAEFFHDICL